MARRGSLRIASIAAGLGLAIMLGTTPAGSAPTTSAATRGLLDGVSCHAADSCEAVGSVADGWNGTKWTVQPISQQQLFGVSCAAANTCEAVGEYVDSSHFEQTFAQGWNGAKWILQTTPSLTSSALNPGLFGVSCAAANSCEAVGYFTDTSASYQSVTLAEGWNGKTWTVQPSPNGSSAGAGSQLYGVSCAAADFCEAVGTYFNSSDVHMALAEHWNGTKWTIQTAPNPSGGGLLNGVFCVDKSFCDAVGSNYSSAEATLAETWNGAKWTIQTTPNPTGSLFSQFNGVSCSGAKACEAVGIVSTNPNNQLAMAERWNGTRWSVQPIPNPKSDNVSLSGISCSGAKACEAVGAFGESSTLEMGWNGTAWMIQ
jgi:hypothetical protein